MNKINSKIFLSTILILGIFSFSNSQEAFKKEQKLIKTENVERVQNNSNVLSVGQSAPKFKYAIFDISKCFWEKELYELLYEFQKKKGIPLSYYFTLIKCGVSYSLGTLDPNKAYESFLSFCKGMKDPEVKENCCKLWNEHCKKFIFTQAKKVFEECKKNGMITILTEAGITEIYSDLLKEFPFDYVCASQVEYKDGVLTGKLLGKPCTGEEKLRKVKDIIEGKLGGSLKEAIFYANSHNDIPLLEKVGKQIVVNPTNQLKSHAKKIGWQILEYKEVIKS